MSSGTATSSNVFASALIAEIQQEAAVARKCLERLPAEKFDWKPHERSMPLGRLASHLGEMFRWTGPTLDDSGIDFAAMDYKPFEPKGTDDLLAHFDESVAAALDVLGRTSDETFMEDWTMRNGEQVYFTMPKAAVMRAFVVNHIVHHRGQLTVYMRLLDIPVPSIYGPSADEGTM
jgi:uncharacterized damage-inducible protein DinB